MTTTPRIRRAALIIFAALPALSACTTAEAEDAGAALGAAELRLEAVSTRAHLVTGGDVLVRVEVGGDLDAAYVQLRANGQAVAVRPGHDGSLIGLVEGLGDGDNRIEATVASGQSEALTVTNYPITGPIISGPHESPYVCQTEGFALATGEPLGPALDDDCSVTTRVDYVYLSSADGAFKPYPSGRGLAGPDDVARTTTLDGVSFPFIVRVQTGTVNRAIYQSAMLHDPTDTAPDPWTRSSGWNGKLVYTHGGGCRNGWFRQGAGTGSVLQEGLLAMGFAVTSSSLNVFGNNCNDLLASETHIMVKERFVESYGVPVYTIGTGGSGGSYQSHQTADNYPGVFDGIIVSSSFPDVTSATIFTLADARLLWHYFNEVAQGAFTPEQQRLVSGFGALGSVSNLAGGAARIDPTFDAGAPSEEQGAEVGRLAELEAMRYGPSNPDGIRATVYDHTVNVYGYDESTGFAARPLDNHGVQYGLAVLNRGEITTEQFLALNRGVGGFDADLDHVPERHRADPTAARRAKDTGRILNGGGGLAATPVVDYRSYTDHREGGDIHMIVHQFTTRARLVEANGHADNHVMNVGGAWGYTEDRPDLGNLFRSMDAWLMNLVGGDASGTPRAERVVSAKPSDLVDNCWDTSGAERRNIREALSVESTGECGAIYPAYATPRQVAGAPLTNDVVTCHLKPLDRGDYDVEMTAAQWSELQAIFPDGVCDWSQGDAHAEGYQGTWLSFGPSPVNRGP